MRIFIKALAMWVPFAIVITGLCGLVYGAVQQNYRQSLNDPQIQMAEDGAAALDAGAVPASLVDRSKPLSDIAASLAPFIAVYDQNGTVLESTGELDAAPPKLPAGVFDTSKWNAPLIGHHLNSAPANEDRFTWQPEPGVREAVVLVHASSGYFVAAGRNMREVENREGNLAAIVGLAWLVLMGATALWFLLSAFVTNSRGE